jgi:hypothetical protein
MQVAVKYPKGEAHRLQPDELVSEFSGSNSFACLCNEVHVLDDGRKVSHFLAQRVAL